MGGGYYERGFDKGLNLMGEECYAYHVPRIVFLAIAMFVLLIPIGASAAPYAPANGKAFNCGNGGYEQNAVSDFAAQAGKHPAAFQYFVEWSQHPRDVGFIKKLLRQSAAERSRAVFHISTKGTNLTPRSIARGAGDYFLLSMNQAVARHDSPVYIRLMSEMNNGNNPYSAYTLSGRSRGAAYSTRAFKNAWRRSVVVMRGGSVATINAKLAQLRLPAVTTNQDELVRAKVAFQWVPLSFGNPEISKNHPKYWWPGSGYVDWVGTTWYSPYRAVSAMRRFYSYRLWNRKPFVFGEYGVWGAESPGFIHDVFKFARRYPRVKMACYYQSSMIKPEFALSTHPRSRSALRRQLKSSRWLGFAPEYR